MRHYLYVLINKYSKKIFYVGVTANIKQRLSAHKFFFGKNIILKIIRSFINYGIRKLKIESDFIIKCLEDGCRLRNRIISYKKYYHFCDNGKFIFLKKEAPIRK